MTAEMRRAKPVNVGELIDWLDTQPADTVLPLSYSTFSYRGYYERLCIDAEVDHPVTAGEYARYLTDRLGEVMVGYKGGNYEITRDTLIHVADYGDTGPQLGIMGNELVLIEERW